MQNVLIIVDSPGDLTREDIEGLPIQVASVYIYFNGKEYLEFEEVDVHKYWEHLEACEAIPTTAQIVPLRWRKYYEEAAAAGYTHVLVYTLSSTASGNFNSAGVGAEMYRSETPGAIPVTVVDSRSYSFIYGRNAIKTAQYIQNGAGFEEACAYIRDLTSRSRGMLWAYTLKHLKRSGRISGMAAFVGEALGLRPVLYIKDGLIEPVDKVRGDKNIIPRAIEIAKQHARNPGDQVMEILYADVPQEEIDRACQLVREAFNPKEIILHQIGCSITTNCGPVSMALCFYGDPFPLG